MVWVGGGGCGCGCVCNEKGSGVGGYVCNVRGVPVASSPGLGMRLGAVCVCVPLPPSHV